ncbi:hypothetical protein [Clostridium sp.]|uniref:hypothetical protein n=1 Tax=Clostridium sp. TaxID=1506 RepID=UPI0025C31955|nr:hypothetical protein [Clostridium sp.]
MDDNKIVFYEIKKIIKSPIILFLIITFFIFDLFIVFSKYYVKDDLKVLNNIIDEVGYKINNDMMGNFKIYYEKNLEDFNDIIYKNEGKRYATVSEYLMLNNAGIYENKYTEKEKKQIASTSIIESYYLSIPELKKEYEKIDFIEMIAPTIKSIRASGEAADLIKVGLIKFDKRFKSLIKNKEYMELSFNGKAYRMHSFLYKEVLGTVLFQIMILIALIVSFLVNYENENNTSFIVYSSRRGRSLLSDKLKAVIYTVIPISTILLAIVLTIYFSIYDYSRVFKTSINSFFNWEGSFPYIGWFNLSVKEYFVLIILLIYVSIFIFIGIAFVVARFIKNSYVSFVICCILNGLGLILPSLMPTSNKLFVYTTLNPFTLVFNLSGRFMQNSFTNFKHYELITISIWIIALCYLINYSIKSFKKCSIN